MFMGKSAISAIALLLMVCQAVSAQSRQPLGHSCKPGIKIQVAAPASLERSDTLELLILGDVMMHSGQLGREFSGFLESLAPVLKSADFAAANLEFSLGGEPYSGYPAFSAPDSIAFVLAEKCGIDIFLTANNHILDRGAEGLARTLDVYSEIRERHGVEYTGCASDFADDLHTSPLTIFGKGISIALVNFTYGTNLGKGPGWPKVNYMNKESVGEAMRKAKENGTDFIIALPHWGTEYSLRHDDTQQEWAEWLVGQGADAVIGSHPHVIQDTAHVDGKPIIYSTGNVVSNMSAKNTRLGTAVLLRFVNSSSSGTKTMLEPELLFTWCCLPGMLSDNYSTIFAKEWATRRNEWLTPSDFDNMVTTLERVRAATGISD